MKQSEVAYGRLHPHPDGTEPHVKRVSDMNKATNDNTMNKTDYIGLDVHKDTTAIAHTFSGSRSAAVYYGECGGSNLAAERVLRKLAKQFEVKLQDFKVCNVIAHLPLSGGLDLDFCLRFIIV